MQYICIHTHTHTYCCCSVTQSCLTICDPMDCGMPSLLVPHHLWEFAQVHAHCISDAIQHTFICTYMMYICRINTHMHTYMYIYICIYTHMYINIYTCT